VTRRVARGVVAVLLSVAALVSCGLPTDDAARPLDSREVPYGLLRSVPPATTPPAQLKSAPVAHARLFLLGPQDRLVAVPPGVQDPPAAPYERLTALLTRLERGPDEQQRAQGLSTALSPGVQIDLLALSGGGIAQVQVVAGLKDPSADRLPLAVGQLVLTATSVAGVQAVQLVRDGAPVEVPLPGGALTSQPLTQNDYDQLVKP
jgi:spore germination protein GerM